MITKYYRGSIAIIVSTLLIASCEDNSNLSKQQNVNSTSQTKTTNQFARVTNYTFDGTEGDPIAYDLASKWITNYSNQNSGAVMAHFFGRKKLEGILGKKGCVGIRFYYSIDGSSNPSLLMIGADGSGHDVLPVYGTKGVNSSIALKASTLLNSSLTTLAGDSIADDTAQKWMTNYVTSNPGGIYAHFFGYELINQILGQTGCIGIRCYYALNDSGVQQLLLIGVDSNGGNILPGSLNGGKTTDGGGTIGDVSAPCPTFCG